MDTWKADRALVLLFRDWGRLESPEVLSKRLTELHPKDCIVVWTKMCDEDFDHSLSVHRFFKEHLTNVISKDEEELFGKGNKKSQKKAWILARKVRELEIKKRIS